MKSIINKLDGGLKRSLLASITAPEYTGTGVQCWPVPCATKTVYSNPVAPDPGFVVVEPLSPVVVDGGCCAPDTIGIYPAQYLNSGIAAERLNVPLNLVKAVRMLWAVGLMTGYVQLWVSFDAGDFIRNGANQVIGVRNGFPMIPQVTLPAGNEHAVIGHSDDVTAYFVGSGVSCLPLILEKPVTKLYIHLLMA